MKKQLDSRRVRMTKRLLKDALLELLEKNELANITVTSICKAADVHRSTFYLYYANPADLLNEIEQDFFDSIPTPSQVLDQESQRSLLDITAAFFEYIRQNRATLHVLFSKLADNSFPIRLVEHLSSGYIPVGEERDELTARFIRLYIANGTVGMLREWVNSGFPVSDQKIAEMMYDLSKRLI